MYGGKGGKGRGGKKGKWNIDTQRSNPLQGGRGKGGKKGGKKADDNTIIIADVLNLAVQKYSRFNGGLLNCSKLVEMEELKKYKPNMSNETWARILTNLIQDIQGCTALTLDHNKIKHLYSLGSHLRSLQLDSLSLRYNDISSIEDISKLEPLNIRHLCLEGNPIYKADPTLLFNSLKKALPSLQMIDATPVDRSTVIDTIQQVPGGIDAQNPLHQSVKEFLDRYFTTTANNSVDELLDFYDTKAVMSMTLGEKFILGASIESSLFRRELDTVSRKGTSPANVFIGKLRVGKCLEALMKKKATFDGSTILQHTEVGQVAGTVLGNTQFPLPTLVTVTLHGAVTFHIEKNKEVKKYFDRTWLLAVKNGAPIILNDMLHLRETKQKPDPVFKKSQVQAYYGLHMKEQDEMVIKLCSATGLSLEVSRSCLDQKESGPWDLQKAQENIHAKMTSGLLTQTHLAHEKDPIKLATQVFSHRTNLKPEKAYQCMEVPEVNFDLMKGWLLFLERQPRLDPSFFNS